MKICWDNLEKLKYDKEKNVWRDNFNRKYIYIEHCKFCKNPFLSLLTTINKFCSKECVSKKTYNLNILLKEVTQTYYWIGFLLADGTFKRNPYNTNRRLVLTLSQKDKDHIIKFMDYIECLSPISYDVDKNSVRISSQDKLITELCYKFDIATNKTYNPPHLGIIESMSDTLFIAFIIGFIDGDGHIGYQTGRKDNFIVIKCHKNWYKILNYSLNRIYILSHCSAYRHNLKPKLINNKYACIHISNTIILKFLKNFIIKNKLIVLNRKWDKVDINIISKYEQSLINIQNIKILLKKGFTNKEICNKLNLKPPCVSQIIKRNKLKYERKQKNVNK